MELVLVLIIMCRHLVKLVTLLVTGAWHLEIVPVLVTVCLVPGASSFTSH